MTAATGVCSNAQRWAAGGSIASVVGKTAGGNDGGVDSDRPVRWSLREERRQACSALPPWSCQPGAGSARLTPAVEPTTTAKLISRDSNRPTARWS
jgi:hypothetical protein